MRCEATIFCVRALFTQSPPGVLPETLTLFQTKMCDFPYPISDLTLKPILYFSISLFQTKMCDFPYPISDLIKNLIPYFRSAL